MTEQTADHRKLERAAQELAIASAGYAAARRNLMDQRRGLPGSGFGGSGAGGSHSPVEAALGLGSNDDHLSDQDLDECGFVVHPDLAQARLDEIDHLLREIQYPAQRLATLVQGNTPHAASDRQKAHTDNDNEVPILCEHCTKHRPTDKVERVHAVGDVGGRLAPLKLGLCQWCYDFVRRYERLPSKGDVQRHNQGLRAKVSA